MIEYNIEIKLNLQGYILYVNIVIVYYKKVRKKVEYVG